MYTDVKFALTDTVNRLGLTARTNRPLARSQYYRILQNPIYCGIIRYNDELYDGKHEPLVSKELFDRVQRILRERRKPKDLPELKHYLYRRIFRCGECGAMITNETQKGFNYLRCTKKKGICSQRYLREDRASQDVQNAISRIAFPQQYIDWMIEELDTRQHDAASALKTQRSALTEKIEAAKGKLDRLTAAYLEQALNLEEYRSEKNKLIEEKVTLEGKLTELRRNPETRLEPTRTLVKVLAEATLLTSADDDREKPKFLKKTGSNLTVQDQHVLVEFKEPWKNVEKYGRLAHPDAAPLHRGAALAGKSSRIFTVAEEQGFEPWRPLRAYRFSRPAHSTTLPLLRG